MNHRPRCKCKRLLEDNIGENYMTLGLAMTFKIQHQRQSHRKIINKLHFIKIKNFCSAKDNVKRMRRQATDCEKIFAKHTSGKGVLSKIKNS